jgi:KipI family sensor histidine kinase inhibitor
LTAPAWRLVPAGDSTLIVELADRVDPAINDVALALAASLAGARIGGVRDVAPTYRTVAIHFNPLEIDHARLAALVREEAAAIRPMPRAAEVIRVPVCYGGELGPDLGDVARFAGLSEPEVVRRHAAVDYRVFMLGFCPGFAYMGVVDPRIAMPRLPAPRASVPPGSVAIAGVQTGIYPFETPGGWRLVGRTPLAPFALDRPEPFMFKAGDTVRFHPIDESEYRGLSG